MNDLREIELNINSLRSSFNARLDNLQEDVRNLKESKPTFSIGQWAVSDSGGHLCTTNEGGLKYKGWKSGQKPNLAKPMRIIDVCYIDPYPRAVVTEQDGNAFVWSCPDDFRPSLPPKKKLPKTESEYKAFIEKWMYSSHNFHEFFNQYAD